MGRQGRGLAAEVVDARVAAAKMAASRRGIHSVNCPDP